MKNIFIYKIQLQHITAIIAVALLVSITSCTKKFDELNTDPTTLSGLTTATIPKAFAKAEYQGIYGDPGIYQLVRNLFMDYWSQYYATVDPGVPTDRYVLRSDWLFYQWSSHYANTWPTLKLVIEATEGTDPSANAIAKIWKAYIFHVTTDIYGPVPYSKAGSGDLSIPYDDQKSIYYDLFNTLDTAVNVLKNADQTLTPYGTNDLIFHGDIPKWIKLGNSLRLRLALRISNVEPDKAKQEAEAAVALGVMTAAEDDAMMDVATPSPNGLNLMSPWGGFRMSASMESYMKGYDDPRMEQYYSPAESDGEYHGVRNGLSVNQIAASAKNKGENLSNVGPRYNEDKAAETKLTVMYAAESFFLRAEGALNGWNMNGTAKDLYEQGINASMQHWGITDANAIKAYTNGDKLPVALSDYLNSPAVANIPVKFASTVATQRQQVITQKWISLFPDGIEAWSDIRRSGFPKLYPVANSDNSDVSPNDIVRRFTFLPGEYQTNKNGVESGLPLLNGPDKASTHVWWDKK